MDGFASECRRQAMEALRQIFRQEATPGSDPLVELIGRLLGDPAVSDQFPGTLTMEQWLTWNELVLNQPQGLLRAMESVLNREQTTLPSDLPSLQLCAECLILSTLDQWELWEDR